MRPPAWVPNIWPPGVRGRERARRGHRIGQEQHGTSWREGEDTVGPRGGRHPLLSVGERSLTEEVTFEWGLEGGVMRRGGIQLGVPGPETTGKYRERG